MSNTSLGLGRCGSKLCLEVCLNGLHKEDLQGTEAKGLNPNGEAYKRLEEQIGLGKIAWISPLKKDKYREYTLKVALEDPRLKEMFKGISWNFWPNRQPQWDAIGLAEDQTLVIVEAKARIWEIGGGCGSTNQTNKNKIYEAISDVFSNCDLWMKKYYQIANRFVFLDKLLGENADRSVKLVFIDFVNDYSHVNEPQAKFEAKMNSIAAQLKSDFKKPKKYDGKWDCLYVDLWKRP